jgi:hypothetical protein
VIVDSIAGCQIALSGKFKNREVYMSYGKMTTIREAQEAKIQPHQPGESVFKSTLSEDVDWKAFAAFPPSVRLAVIVGRPSEPGVYTIRVKAPHGVKLMPHKHPEDRVHSDIGGFLHRTG